MRLVNLVPWRLRYWLECQRRAAVLRRACRELSALARGELPPRRLLSQLRYGWGNETWTAAEEYLEIAGRVALATDGPLLECGSGLSSIVLGTLLQTQGRQLFSLEHDPTWAQQLNEVLQRQRLTRVHLVVVPLRNYGSFSWYDVDGLALPESVGAVFCDGPPASTLGGRYGLLPVLGTRLSAGSVIVLDDAQRPGEQEIIGRWCAERSATVDKPTRRVAIINLR